MKHIFYFIVLLISLSFISCIEKKGDGPDTNSKCTKIPFLELIELLNQSQVDLSKITYRDSVGNELSDSLRSQLNQGKLFREFFRNSNDDIAQIRLRILQEKDIFKEIQIRELLSNPMREIDKMDINCNVTDSLLLDAFRKDQDIRKGIDVGVVDVDGENQVLVSSIIEQCGWPDNKELIESIWYVIQHSNSGLMAYYYPKFIELVDKGLLDKSTMALMEDRMLMTNGFPQIYGSQIVGQNVYIFRDPINIDKRRKEVGLPTMKENTKRFGFEFKIEDYLEK
jgi:hypothetical protein